MTDIKNSLNVYICRQMCRL